jgi:hypothetical protein
MKLIKVRADVERPQPELPYVLGFLMDEDGSQNQYVWLLLREDGDPTSFILADCRAAIIGYIGVDE